MIYRALLVAVLLVATPALGQDCKKVVQQAAEQGVLDVDGFGPEGLRLLVQDRFWHAADLRTKRGMLNAVECALAGNDKRLLLEVRSMRDGRLLARRTITKDYELVE